MSVISPSAGLAHAQAYQQVVGKVIQVNLPDECI
jgi:hypothetical protein